MEPNSKSFHALGTKEQTDKLLSYLENYKSDNVVAINHLLASCAKPHFKQLNRSIDVAQETISTYFSATDIGKVYNINNTQTVRSSIAIIELGGGYKSADLTAYWNYLGLTIKPNVYAVSVDGAKNTPGSDADMEVVLDIEIAGGICPSSNIYVYFAPNTNNGFYDAIHAAIYSTTYPVSVISISWGGPENEWDSNNLTAFNSLFEAAAKKGITICVASGDSGSSDGESTGNHVDFPSSSPWSLACGGTNLVCPNRIYDTSTKETVWGTIPDDGAAGGGFSNVFDAQTYQATFIKPYSTTKRGVPDVCGDADPLTGWIIYINGSYSGVGGTSAVAPMWAGYLAGIEYKSFVTPVLYSLYPLHRTIVHDITVGNEGTYKAAVGWDPASGLGSPNGSILTPLLKTFSKLTN